MRYSTITQIEKAIDELEKNKERLQAQRDQLLNLTDAKRLAVIAHDILCRHNHTDGCSWYYEFTPGDKLHIWDEAKKYSAHMEWFRKAQVMLAVTDDVDLIIRILEASR